MKSKDEIKGIYLIERIKTSDDDHKKYYIGQALDIFKRLNQHCTVNNPGVDEAILKYGPDNFSFRILEIVKSQKNLNACESKWIETYREKYGDSALYNISQTNNPRYRIDPALKREVVSLFREDIGQSIYAIAEHYNISYDKIIDIRKPILKENNLKWYRGKIINMSTKEEPENWRGYQLTRELGKRILKELNEGKSEQDIRYVSTTDLRIFLNSKDKYIFAPAIDR